MRNRCHVVAVLVCLLIGSYACADSIDEMEAKKQGISVEQAQINRLKDEKSQLLDTVSSLKKQAEADKKKAESDIAALKQQVAELSAQVDQAKKAMGPAAKAKLDQQDAIAANTVVLSARDFAALPKDKKGQGLGFLDVKVDSMGWIHTALVEQVVDDKTAIVSISLDNNGYGKRGRVSGTDINASLIIEGLPTADLADHNGWTLMRWFKVVGTKKQGGTTYFVAHPIVQAENKTPAPSPTQK